MERMFNLRFLFVLIALTFVVGCEQVDDKRRVPESAVRPPVVDTEKTRENLRVSTEELDLSTLNAEDKNTPEGVVNFFFKAFFSGDDDYAFNLLTSKAQKAKRGSFVAQESNCVSWRIVGKTKPLDGRVKVLVELEDYDEGGEFQTDLLTFLLTNDDSEWRIARFGVGELEIDFEEQTSNSSAVARTAGTRVNENR